MSTQDDILKQIEQNNSAEELNKNTQYVYVYDLVYVICKVFLFVILGIIYIMFFKNVETMKNVLGDAKDNIMAVKDKITDKIKPLMKEKEIKPIEVTNSNSNSNTNKVKDTNTNSNKNKQPKPTV
jgi:hypothetical protein